jgi:aspartate racemase
MKIAGMIGGLGPESTVDYYRLIIARYRSRNPDGSYPSLIIDSLDLAKGIRLVDSGELSQLADYLAASVDRLTRAGAAFAFFSANTPHLVFDEVQRRSAIPLLSIVRAACDRAQTLRLKKVGLLGTRFTMQASFYPDVFSRYGISLAVPNPQEQDYIHEKYFGELVHGTVLPETRRRLEEIVTSMKSRDSIQGLIVGGTELSLIFREPEVGGIPVLDTTQIHVEAAISRMLA